MSRSGDATIEDEELKANDEPAEDEEELLDEPKFKYERVIGDVAAALTSNAASCIAVHDKFVCIGFADGRVRFFDPCGIEHFKSHALRHNVSVKHLAVERSGHYVISCANDNKVIVQGFGETEYSRVRLL